MPIISSPALAGLKAALNDMHASDTVFANHLMGCLPCLTPGAECREGDHAEQQLTTTTDAMLAAARGYAPVGQTVTYRREMRWHHSEWTVAGHIGSQVVLVHGDERVMVPVTAVSL